MPLATIDPGATSRRLRPTLVKALAVVGVLAGLAIWVAAALLVATSQDVIPHDWTHGPGSGADFVTQSLVALVEVGALGVLVYLITRRRTDERPLAAHVPDRATAAQELLVLLVWSLVGLVMAAALPAALGWSPFSWHLTGTLRGTHVPPGIAETLTWAAFNLVVFAVLPLAWFRARGTGTLPLRSTNLRADVVLVVVVLALETAVQVLALHPETLSLAGHEQLLGGAAAFLLYLAGAVLPTVVLIHALILPRVHRLTGSTTLTVLAGGLAYALFHLWDSGLWHEGQLVGLALLVLTYLGPGLFKAWLTVRTGNAWTHAWAYHALAPHVLVDTALVVAVFRI